MKDVDSIKHCEVTQFLRKKFFSTNLILRPQNQILRSQNQAFTESTELCAKRVFSFIIIPQLQQQMEPKFFEVLVFQVCQFCYTVGAFNQLPWVDPDVAYFIFFQDERGHTITPGSSSNLENPPDTSSREPSRGEVSAPRASPKSPHLWIGSLGANLRCTDVTTRSLT